MLIEYNGRVVFTQPTPGEMCDAWKLRGMPEEMLHPSSEFARFLISHAIAQSVSDAVIVAANQLYLTKVSLEDSASLNFEFESSPREAFLFLTQGVPPSVARKASLPREVPPSNSLSLSFSKCTKFIKKDTRGKRNRINCSTSASNTRGAIDDFGRGTAPVIGNSFDQCNNTAGQIKQVLERELQALDAGSGADDDEQDALEEYFHKVSRLNVVSGKWSPYTDSDSELEQAKSNEEEQMAEDRLKQVLKKKRRIERRHRRCHIRKVQKIKVVDSAEPIQGESNTSFSNTCGRENCFYAKRLIGDKSRNMQVLRAANSRKRRLSLQNISSELRVARITLVKPRGSRARAKPVVNDAMTSKIDALIANSHEGSKQTIHDSNTQHYLDFCEAQAWTTLPTDPYRPRQARQMERYIVYEKAVHDIKGDTIEQACISESFPH